MTRTWPDWFLVSKCKCKFKIILFKFHKKVTYWAVKLFILLKYHEKDTFSTVKLSILLKFHEKDSFTENYRRNLDQKGCFTPLFVCNRWDTVQYQGGYSIMVEILIKKVLLQVKGSFKEKYGRNLDQKGSFIR